MNNSDYCKPMKKSILEKEEKQNFQQFPLSILDNYCYSIAIDRPSIPNPSREEAIKIYKQMFWTLAGCDRMPQRLAIAHFDWVVNYGVGNAIIDLQACLGNTTIDGRFSAETEKHLTEYLNDHGEEALLDTYLQKRREVYLKGDPRFRQIWLKRLHDLELYVYSLSRRSKKLERATPGSITVSLFTALDSQNLSNGSSRLSSHRLENLQKQLQRNFAKLSLASEAV
jgi:hypothetical protein